MKLFEAEQVAILSSQLWSTWLPKIPTPKQTELVQWALAYGEDVLLRGIAATAHRFENYPDTSYDTAKNYCMAVCWKVMQSELGASRVQHP